MNSECQKFVSRDINGKGFDLYEDGTLCAWDEGNGAFNQCEATGNLFAYVPVAALRAAIVSAEKDIGVVCRHGIILPGSDELLLKSEGE